MLISYTHVVVRFLDQNWRSGVLVTTDTSLLDILKDIIQRSRSRAVHVQLLENISDFIVLVVICVSHIDCGGENGNKACELKKHLVCVWLWCRRLLCVVLTWTVL